MSNAWRAEVRAPVSSLALIQSTPRSGRLTHSRQPATLVRWDLGTTPIQAGLPPGARRGGVHVRSFDRSGPDVKLAILSRAPRSYSTQRLRTAALDRGHAVKVLNTLRFGIDLSGDEPDLQFRGRQLSTYDAVLPRIGNSITYYGTAVVRQFEQMSVYTPNTAGGITNSRDKLRATQILSRHGV